MFGTQERRGGRPLGVTARWTDAMQQFIAYLRREFPQCPTLRTYEALMNVALSTDIGQRLAVGTWNDYTLRFAEEIKRGVCSTAFLYQNNDRGIAIIREKYLIATPAQARRIEEYVQKLTALGVLHKRMVQDDGGDA